MPRTSPLHADAAQGRAEAPRRRALRASPPEVHDARTRDGAAIRLTRYRGGSKGPVLCTHGLGVSSLIFSTDTIETNLLEALFAAGYDVWLLDFRLSIALDAAAAPADGDAIALEDYPAAVDLVRRITGAPSVQVVAHCFGSTTFLMAMLAGLEGVRSAVCSQASARLVVPRSTRLKAALRTGSVLEALGARSLSARPSPSPGLIERLWDGLLRLQPVPPAERCGSRVCRRITFLYSRLYEHAQLAPPTHEALGELFGAANIKALRHLTVMVRRGRIVDARGADRYYPRLERLAIPMTHIHGARNVCFLPQSSAEAIDDLSRRNGSGLYRRIELERYGHIDCIFGRSAAADVFPLILEHLERT